VTLGVCISCVSRMCVWECMFACVCVCGGERERERECVCICVWRIYEEECVEVCQVCRAKNHFSKDDI